VRASATHHETWFLVPDELLQQAAGQRQDRTSEESQGQVSYQHIFGPSLVGAVRGMVRDVAVGLWSNPLATPIAANQDRGFREGYFNASLSGHRGRHEWKAGGEASFASIREAFGYHITAYEIDGIRIFDKDTPPTFAFNGRAQDREQSAYVQDLIRMGSVTLSAGLRFDHYRLLVDETAFSPAWALPGACRASGWCCTLLTTGRSVRRRSKTFWCPPTNARCPSIMPAFFSRCGLRAAITTKPASRRRLPRDCGWKPMPSGAISTIFPTTICWSTPASVFR